SGENTERAEPGSPPALQLVRRHGTEAVERFPQALPEQPGSLVAIGLRAALRLGDDAVDHTELETVERIGLERGGGLLGLAGVAPEDRRTTLRGDHRVDRVLLHDDAVRDRERRRPAGSTLPVDPRDGRDLQPR